MMLTFSGLTWKAGQERTAAECRARAAWDRHAAKVLRTSNGVMGEYSLAEGHERCAEQYEALASAKARGEAY